MGAGAHALLRVRRAHAPVAVYDVDEIDELFGGDPWPYGVERIVRRSNALVQIHGRAGLHLSRQSQLWIFFVAAALRGTILSPARQLARKRIHQPGNRQRRADKKHERPRRVFHSPFRRLLDRQPSATETNSANATIPEMAQVQPATRHLVRSTSRPYDFASISPPQRNSARVQHSQQVHDPCGSHKARAVIARRARNIRPRFFHQVRDHKKHSRARIREKSQSPERIVRWGGNTWPRIRNPEKAKPATTRKT